MFQVVVAITSFAVGATTIFFAVKFGKIWLLHASTVLSWQALSLLLFTLRGFFRQLWHVLPSCATLGTPQRWILIGRLSYMLVL